MSSGKRLRFAGSTLRCVSFPDARVVTASSLLSGTPCAGRMFISGACNLLTRSQQVMVKLLRDQTNSKASLLKLGVSEECHSFNRDTAEVVDNMLYQRHTIPEACAMPEIPMKPESGRRKTVREGLQRISQLNHHSPLPTYTMPKSTTTLKIC